MRVSFSVTETLSQMSLVKRLGGFFEQQIKNLSSKEDFYTLQRNKNISKNETSKEPEIDSKSSPDEIHEHVLCQYCCTKTQTPTFECVANLIGREVAINLLVHPLIFKSKFNTTIHLFPKETDTKQILLLNQFREALTFNNVIHFWIIKLPVYRSFKLVENH